MKRKWNTVAHFYFLILKCFATPNYHILGEMKQKISWLIKLDCLAKAKLLRKLLLWFKTSWKCFNLKHVIICHWGKVLCLNTDCFHKNCTESVLTHCSLNFKSAESTILPISEEFSHSAEAQSAVCWCLSVNGSGAAARAAFNSDMIYYLKPPHRTEDMKLYQSCLVARRWSLSTWVRPQRGQANLISAAAALWRSRGQSRTRQIKH